VQQGPLLCRQGQGIRQEFEGLKVRPEFDPTLQVANRPGGKRGTGRQGLLREACHQAIALEECTKAALFLHMSSSSAQSLLPTSKLFHHDTTLSPAEKSVGNVWLLFLMEATILSYTRIRNRL